ncbi:hypothetical protein GV64_12390 [Endozoicomonas elysicola]|uniref:Uncharacterized protein n=1 Tax=Endozoicomonas elysicola TaxID=305900 RepID=A0A081KBA6_9GAMM|nr:hypothetical protein GV64_12390 [Endozoicomonas elysicola]
MSHHKNRPSGRYAGNIVSTLDTGNLSLYPDFYVVFRICYLDEETLLWLIVAANGLELTLS